MCGGGMLRKLAFEAWAWNVMLVYGGTTLHDAQASVTADDHSTLTLRRAHQE